MERCIHGLNGYHWRELVILNILSPSIITKAACTMQTCILPIWCRSIVFRLPTNLNLAFSLPSSSIASHEAPEAYSPFLSFFLFYPFPFPFSTYIIHLLLQRGDTRPANELPEVVLEKCTTILFHMLINQIKIYPCEWKLFVGVNRVWLEGCSCNFPEWLQVSKLPQNHHHLFLCNTEFKLPAAQDVYIIPFAPC